MTRLTLVHDLADMQLGASLAELAAFLESCGHTVAVVEGEALGDSFGDAGLVVVFADRAPDVRLQRAVSSGVTGPLLLAGPTVHAWRDCAVVESAGVLVGARTPQHEIRVRPGPHAAGVGMRFGADLVVTEPLVLLDKVRDDVETLLSASFQLADVPVATLRHGAAPIATLTLGSGARTLADPRYRRLLHLVLRRLAGTLDAPPVRVGMLGYGAIGHQHHSGVVATEGLSLELVCDRDARRVDSARTLTPDVRGTDDAGELIDDPDVDVVIVSTPPSSHADWAVSALDRGKHVVVEKPLALTVDEADRMMSAAAAADRLLVCYQNRRWDGDYLALKRVVTAGAIGEVFHYESFVGGYAHPCSYWHSDESVSGGALYDWGSHYVDWLLDLLPGEIRHVTAAAHKRVWHDVTNADFSRLTVRFTDGTEAEFAHSDLAAAAKPKWLILGTRGAVRGEWRSETVVARDTVGNLAEDRLADSESPARLHVFTPVVGGGLAETVLPSATAEPYAFHRELADRLLTGLPMTVTAEQSRRTVAVLEAATESIRADGAPVRPRR